MNNRRKVHIAVIGLLIASAFAVTEVMLPAVAEKRVSKRIAERLNTEISDVDVEAFPAARLLFKDYERIGFTMPSVIEAPDRLQRLGIERLELEPTAEGALIANDPDSNLSLKLASDGTDLEVDAVGMGPLATFVIDSRLNSRIDVGLESLLATRVPAGIRLELEGLEKNVAA